MSRKAQALAVSLATLANANMIAKGYGSAVTPDAMLPAAVVLVSIERSTRQADRLSARIAKRLDRNAKLMESLTGEPPDFSPPRPAGYGPDGVLATIDQALAAWTADTRGLPGEPAAD